MKTMLGLSILLVFAGISRASSASVDAKTLCSTESEKHLIKLTQKGETRFSAFQFNPDSTKVFDVEFTDLGATGRRHRRSVQVPAKPEYGQMLVMQAMGKEKAGWRNLVIKCGVHKGKVATFTYEILSMAEASNLSSTVVAPAGSAAPSVVTPVSPAAHSSPGPASAQSQNP